MYDLEKDLLDGCGLFVYMHFRSLWLENQRADRFPKTMGRQNNLSLISNRMLKSDSQFLKGGDLTYRPYR